MAREQLGTAPSGDSDAVRLADVPVQPYATVSTSNNTNDTVDIQAVLNSGGTIVFPSGGTWLIDAEVGLSPVSNSRIIIEQGATLQVIANDAGSYELFNIGRDGAVNNVVIEGYGTIRGDVDTHTGTTGEWGHLVFITNGSSDIVVRDVTVTKAWGDGVYVGGGSGPCSNVLIENVTAFDCRREGIAPFWVDGCTVRNCHVYDIGQTAQTGPQTGIDCEPNPGQYVNRLTIEGCLVERTPGIGILVSDNTGGDGYLTNVIMRDNTVVECGEGDWTGLYGELYKFNGIHIAGVTSAVLMNNVVKSCGTTLTPSGGAEAGITLRACENVILDGGHVLDSLNMGVFVWSCANPVIRNVTVENSLGPAMWVYNGDGAIVTGNQFLNNVLDETLTTDHLQLNTADNCLVDGNTFRGSEGRCWVRVQSTADNPTIINNIGLGAAPLDTPLSDTGTTTTQSNNVHKVSGAATPWSGADAIGRLTTAKKDFSNIAAGCNFEDGNIPFALPASTWTLATDQYYSGTQSLKIAQTSATVYSIELNADAQAGDQFLVTFWARKDAAWNGGALTRWRIAHGPANTLISVYQISTYLTVDDTWTQLSFTVTAPANCTYMRFAFNADSTAGTLWLDDITIRRLIPSNLLPAVIGRVAVPATATSPGVSGQYASDSTHFYSCVATNAWRRVAIASW